MNRTHNIFKAETSPWANAAIQNFWGEIAPCDHLVQIYESEKIFINTLEGFVGDGFLRGEAVIVIGSDEHLAVLQERLLVHGFDMEMLCARDQFIALRIEEATSFFMVNDWPEESLFFAFVSSLMERAKKNSSKVRVFGEIVADLWGRGMLGATVHLENLWHRMQHSENFCLFCAYPKKGFTQNVNESLKQICNTHSKIIDGNSRPSTEIYYIDVNQHLAVSPT